MCRAQPRECYITERRARGAVPFIMIVCIPVYDPGAWTKHHWGLSRAMRGFVCTTVCNTGMTKQGPGVSRAPRVIASSTTRVRAAFDRKKKSLSQR
jgi:hypothetical protein